MEKLEFKIKLSVKDLYYFLMYHYYTKSSGIFGVGLSIFAAVTLYRKFPTLDMNGKVVLLIFSLMFTVINPIMMWTKAARQIKTNKSLGGELIYGLDDEHLSVQLEEEAAELSWEQVVRVKDNGKELVVYVSMASGYIWPKKQIEAQYDQIIAILKKNVDARKLRLKD